VENAIYHGIKNKRRRARKVSAGGRAAGVQADDGCGFSPEPRPR
jgi:sensor histidine kinase YesM